MATTRWTSAVCALALGGCATAPRPADPRLLRAEQLIDAFYSFDPASLRAALADAPGSQGQILYYQGWAEGGHYKVIDRKPCHASGADKVLCDITVRDDLIAALGTGYWVTDTFHLTFAGGRIVEVDTSSNDPPMFEQALDWVKRERPAVMRGPCLGFFKGGPTPQACVRAIVSGFAEYRALDPGQR